MRFYDDSRGRLFAKDPAVVRFEGRYWLYYSVSPHHDGRRQDGWRIGIAVSDDLDNWEKVGELAPDGEHEQNGLCAPGAIVLDNTVHLFYQTYGNGPRDAICHASSKDGLTFTRHSENPIFRPTGAWNNGRAIDADVVAKDGTLFLYTASRDPSGQRQLLCVATAPLTSAWGVDDWTQRSESPLLEPELDWEQDCIEAPAVLVRNGVFHMFYAGAYNNAPQQIGHAVSADGIHWERTSKEPFLSNGGPGTWNESESGHPFVFQGGARTHLFFQGNNDNGKTWYLSRVEVAWTGDDKPWLTSLP